MFIVYKTLEFVKCSVWLYALYQTFLPGILTVQVW